MLIIILAVLSAIELSIWLPPLWRFRREMGAMLSVLLTITSVSLIISNPGLGTILIGYFSLYRVINLLRLVKDRVQSDYLYTVSRRTAASLIICQIGVVAVWALSRQLHWTAHGWLAGLALVQLVVGLALFIITWFNLRLTSERGEVAALSDAALPALTVAIPARNETEDLQACLESLVGSDYPKLEILVLDDCSQNRQTSEIIRDFAHAGVRFIGGEVPPDNWLAKNFAYHQLAQAASGEIILFCGVDTRFSAGSLRAMARTMLARKDEMLSWLPCNVAAYSSNSVIQPNRYAWELVLPRFWLKRPPVLSTCWLVTTELLRSGGEFKSLRRNASPESYFARLALKQQAYGFLQGGPATGLTTVKSLAEQRATAIRTRYLQLHRKPELVALAGLAELMITSAPAIVLAALLSDNPAAAILSGLATILLAVTYGRIVNLTYRRFRPYGLVIFPLAIIYDVALLNYSLRQYEFNQVIWKGRNICLPVMRTRVTAD